MAIESRTASAAEHIQMRIANLVTQSTSVGYTAALKFAAVLQCQINKVTCRKHTERKRATITRKLGVPATHECVRFPASPLECANTFDVRGKRLDIVGRFDRSEIRPRWRCAGRYLGRVHIRVVQPPVSTLYGPLIC